MVTGVGNSSGASGVPNSPRPTQAEIQSTIGPIRETLNNYYQAQEQGKEVSAQDAAQEQFGSQAQEELNHEAFSKALDSNLFARFDISVPQNPSSAEKMTALASLQKAVASKTDALDFHPLLTQPPGQSIWPKAIESEYQSKLQTSLTRITTSEETQQKSLLGKASDEAYVASVNKAYNTLSDYDVLPSAGPASTVAEAEAKVNLIKECGVAIQGFGVSLPTNPMPESAWPSSVSKSYQQNLAKLHTQTQQDISDTTATLKGQYAARAMSALNETYTSQINTAFAAAQTSGAFTTILGAPPQTGLSVKQKGALLESIQWQNLGLPVHETPPPMSEWPSSVVADYNASLSQTDAQLSGKIDTNEKEGNAYLDQIQNVVTKWDTSDPILHPFNPHGVWNGISQLSHSLQTTDPSELPGLLANILEGNREDWAPPIPF